MSVTLASGDLEATFVPEAGMVGCSLTHRGEELLGQRGGLEAYIAERKTMGIPLLYPWANRLSTTRFTVSGREVDIDPERTPLRLDGSGLPMHGLLGAAPGWRVEHQDEATLEAVFDFAADEALMAAFPFDHALRIDVTLDDITLRVATTVTAGTTGVPIAFGFHPYLMLPGVPRADWRVEIPVTEQLELDEQMLPTGNRTAVEIPAGPLGDRTFDDAYLAPPAPFALEGGGRRIELDFETGYPYAQVFAPPGDALIAFEPMTAPTNALVSGDFTPLEPGDSYRAVFAISVR
ncbi:aldose 1-epimerase [Solirubrobacter taibaiensis]|nr:aldose 1-epimerase [Solirubrobacter taibaiensis]